MDSPETPLLDLIAAIAEQDRGGLQTLAKMNVLWNSEVVQFTPGEVGVFLVRGEADAGAVRKAVSDSVAAINRISRLPPTAPALERAKVSVALSWAHALAVPESRSDFLAEWHALSGWQSAEPYFHDVLAARRRRLQSVAQEWLSPDACKICIHVPVKPATARTFAFRPASKKRVRRIETVSHPVVLAPRSRLTLCDVAGDAMLFRTAANIPALAASIATNSGLVSVGVYVRGGRSDENQAIAGITNVLAGALATSERGRREPHWQALARRLGVEVVPYLGHEYFGWSVRVARRDIARALELLTALITQPVVAAEAVDRSRRAALRRLAQNYEAGLPTSVAASLSGAYPNHAYGLPDDGIASAVQSLTATEVTAWRDYTVRRPRVAFGIFGPLSVADLRSLKFDIDADLDCSPTPTPGWPTQPTIVPCHRAWRDVGLAVIFPTAGLAGASMPVIDAIAGVLVGGGSRLITELRFESALCYLTVGVVRTRGMAGAIGLYVQTSERDVATCHRKIISAFRRLGRGQIDARELDVVKKQLLERWTSTSATWTSRRRHLLHSWYFRTLASYGGYADELQEVSSESIAQCVHQWATASRPVTGVVGRGISLASPISAELRANASASIE